MWRTVLLSLFAVAALIVGLIAMHSLNLDNSHHAAGLASPAADHHAPASSTTDTSALASHTLECGGEGCDPGHSMSFMTCILALLVASIAFGVAVTALLGRHGNIRRQLQLLVTRLHSAIPPPPSLHVLSISRT
ncbi:MAG: DUF6153 family protein [Ilumatobacteraceae bacterium]